MITDPPRDASTLFLDMNSYFARVEQQVQPIYRGKPVGITPYLGDSGCVIAASYEAKALGITTGYRVGEAKKVCPSIIILPARPALYHLYHKEILKTLESFSPFVRVLSIDEFSIRLTGSDRDSERGKVMARGIKDAFRTKVGDWLTCSIGIAPNKFLAKTAAEMYKPDGLFEIRLRDIPTVYDSLELTDLCGINRGIHAQCNRYGVYTIQDLFNKDMSALNRMFGILGKAWYLRLRGYEVDDIDSQTKSIGHSHVLAPEYRNESGARKVIDKLVEKAGFRLRKNNYWATGIYVSIRFYNHRGWSKFVRVPPFQNSHTFREIVRRQINECNFGLTPFTVAVSATGLVRDYRQPVSLFPEMQKLNQLSNAMDKLNDKYGPTTIYPATMMGAEHSAPDRIPFGRPRFEIINE